MIKIEAVRTPRQIFYNLPGWNYTPGYIDDLPSYEGLRAHYIDEGPTDAHHTFLCLRAK